MSAASLVIETLFARLLTYTFGNTAEAVSAVLAVFLGGLALGALRVGRVVDRQPPSLRFYGGLELLVGGYSLWVPFLFSAFTRYYVHLCHSFGFGLMGVAVRRFALAAPLIFPASFLMGGTLPAMARFVAEQVGSFEARIDRLYALNTLGAAAGNLVAACLLLPSFGVRGTLWLACGLDFCIFASVIALAPGAHEPRAQETPAIAWSVEDNHAIPAAVSHALLAGGFLPGMVALTHEVTWTHVLAFLIGNSVYAFGLCWQYFCSAWAGAQVGWGVSVRTPRVGPGRWRSRNCRSGPSC